MKVVFVNLSPPVGPAWVPVSLTFNKSQAIESALTVTDLTKAGPDGARVPGILPGGAYDAVLHRIWAGEVGDKLLFMIVEQRRLRCKQCKGDA